VEWTSHWYWFSISCSF